MSGMDFSVGGRYYAVMKQLHKFLALGLGCLFFLTALSPVTAQAQRLESVFIHSAKAQNCAILTEQDQWQPAPLFSIQENVHTCLRAPIQLNESQQGAWLRMSALVSSRIFWDGQLIAENGRPAATANEELPGKIDFQAYIPPELMAEGSHELRIELSTHHVGRDLHVIFYCLSLDPFHTDLSLPSSQLIAVGIVAALSVFALLFFCLFGLYQPRLEYLAFASLCACSAALLLIEKWRDLFNYSYDFHVLRLWCVLLLTYCVSASLCGLYFLQSRFTKFLPFFGIVLVMLAATLIPLSFDARCALLFMMALLYCCTVSALSLREVGSANRINALVAVSALALLLLQADQFLESLFSYLAIAIACVMTASLIRDMKQQKRRAMNALRLELDLLKKSIQPHFLMNSLTLLMEWVETQPKLALKFIEELAEEFRLLIRFSSQPLIELEDELSLCRHHLRIMSLRYEREFELELKGNLVDIKIPPAILHTQIENSFSHGPLTKNTQFVVELEKLAPATLRIRLFCPMSEQPQHASVGFGLGHKYIAARLQEHFGRRHRFISRQLDEHTWCTELELPCTF